MQTSTGEIFLFRMSLLDASLRIRYYNIWSWKKEKIDFIVFAISSVIKEAEANRLKLTPEFLQLKFIQAIANNTKIFFGDKVFPSSPMLIFVCPCTLT